MFDKDQVPTAARVIGAALGLGALARTYVGLAASSADVGTRIGTEPAAQFVVVTVVLEAPVASVTLPTAFDLPAASC